MSTDQSSQINGFFTIEVQKPSRKIGWFFGLIFGAGLSYIGVGGAVNMIRGEAGQLSGTEIILWIFSLIIGFLLVIRGLIVLFKRSGVYFKGMRITRAGIETGSMIVQRNAIEPKSTWEKSYAGTIQTMRWSPGNQIMGDQLNMVILLKESGHRANCYFFERFIIASNVKAVFELRGSKGRNDLLGNDLVAMSNGEFHLLGGMIEVDYHAIIPSLKYISDALSSSGYKIACTLNILAQTVDMAHLGFMAGMLGTLVGSGINALSRKGLVKRLQDGRKFDNEFTEELMNFANNAGWVIAVEGEDVQLS